MPNTLLFANNATSTVAVAISNTATSVQLLAGSGNLFPNPGAGQYFLLTFTDAATGLITEICQVTSRTGDVLTLVRAQEGTTALAWAVGDNVGNLNTAGTQQYLAALASVQPLFVESTAPFTMAGAGFYVYTGPAGSTTMATVSGNTNAQVTVKNRGSGNLTLNAAGSDEFFAGTLVTSIIIPIGASFNFLCDGTYWNLV